MLLCTPASRSPKPSQTQLPTIGMSTCTDGPLGHGELQTSLRTRLISWIQGTECSRLRLRFLIATVPTSWERRVSRAGMTSLDAALDNPQALIKVRGAPHTRLILSTSDNLSIAGFVWVTIFADTQILGSILCFYFVVSTSWFSRRIEPALEKSQLPSPH